MAIIKMQKVAVIGLEKAKSDLIAQLMDLEAVELTDQTDKLSDEVWAENVIQDSDQEHGNAGRRPCPVRSVSIMLVVLSNSPHVLPQSVCLTSGPFRHLCYCIIFLR